MFFIRKSYGTSGKKKSTDVPHESTLGKLKSTQGKSFFIDVLLNSTLVKLNCTDVLFKNIDDKSLNI